MKSVSLAVLIALCTGVQAQTASGPLHDAIQEGKVLLTETRLRLPDHVGNGLNCTSCHLEGGTKAYASPWIGIWGVFPEYRARSGRVISLQQRVNDCFQRSMNGKPLDEDSPQMMSMLAYMQWLSRGVPTGKSIEGRGFGKIDQRLSADRAKGKQVFETKCASCHGADGMGIKAAKDPSGGAIAYTVPPLWGPDSFNDGAGMARTYTAAAFVKYNMPLGQGGTLSDQEAVDVAEFFTHQERPVFDGKSSDWPRGDKPKDARN